MKWVANFLCAHCSTSGPVYESKHSEETVDLTGVCLPGMGKKNLSNHWMLTQCGANMQKLFILTEEKCSKQVITWLRFAYLKDNQKCTQPLSFWLIIHSDQTRSGQTAALFWLGSYSDYWWNDRAHGNSWNPLFLNFEINAMTTLSHYLKDSLSSVTKNNDSKNKSITVK